MLQYKRKEVNNMQSSKVVIIGTGLVGMSYAYSLVNQGVVEELVLIDINKDKAVGESMDLNHGLAFSPRKMKIYAGEYSDCKDANLVVITAGVGQKDGENRIHLLNRNASIMKTVVRNVMDSGFKGIFLVATNPVDILTYVVWKESGMDSSRVIGSGTSLDTARLRYEISSMVNISVANIHAYILGEHGDSEFVCWSNAFIGAKPILNVIEDMKEINFEDLDKIYLRVKNAAYEIIQKKNATYYAIGLALVKITTAILNNENRIMPISVYNNGVYQIEKDVYIGLPAVINKDGIHHVVKLKLSVEELVKLNASADMLKKHLDSMEF